ncbi:hypothetical protein JNW88_05270 [Micromonospora sp. ATA32]|nr:hypothetical protein [Micromonospora sp. ATA32]
MLTSWNGTETGPVRFPAASVAQTYTVWAPYPVTATSARQLAYVPPTGVAVWVGAVEVCPTPTVADPPDIPLWVSGEVPVTVTVQEAVAVGMTRPGAG